MDSDKYVIADLLKENQQLFAKMYNEDDYIKSLMSTLEPYLVQQGVELAVGNKTRVNSLAKEIANICGKVSLAYSRKYLLREKIKDNFKIIDILRGKVHD